MWIGWPEADLLLGDVHSLKEKRSIVRPLVASLSRRTEAAVAGVGAHDLHRHARIEAGVVSGEPARVREVLGRAAREIVGHPEVWILSTHRGLHSSED